MTTTTIEEGDARSEIQAELQEVKKALRNGSTHLGMKGDNLQKYLLQLSEKENLLLSYQLHGGNAYKPAPPPPPPPAPRAFMTHASTNGSVADMNGAHGPEPHPQRMCSQVAIEARPAPPGEPKAFDRNALEEVLAHMCDYEAVALECARALRALTSLAYNDPVVNAEDARVLPQLLRILAIHHAEPQVHFAGMRVLCNLSYDPDTALKRLTSPDVLRAILKGMDAFPDSKDVGPKASEAAARLVAAEVCPTGSTVVDGGPIRTVSETDLGQDTGPLAGFFSSALTGDAARHRVVAQLALQLLQNEVILPAKVAERFVVSADSVPATADGAVAAWGWLSISKSLCALEPMELGQCLVEANCIRAADKLMEMHAADAATQLVGVEAQSCLIGNRLAGLEAFSEVQGITRIEAAMRAHTGDVTLQTKGIRAMSCGILWPQAMQERAGYKYTVGLELTLAGMSKHPDDAELLIAGLEALTKYMEKLRCQDEIKAAGAEGLVKAMMTRHVHVPRIQQIGKTVLEGLGCDKNWQPRQQQPAV